MNKNLKIQAIAAAIIIGASAYGEYQLRKIDRKIAEGEKRIAETNKFTLYIPVPPEMPSF